MTVHFIDEQHQVGALLPKLMEKPSWGFDTETTGVDPFRDNVIMAQFGRPEEQFVVDTRKVNLEPLRPFFESEAHKKIIHNAHFDYRMMKGSLGIEIEGVRDTMLAEKVLNIGRKMSGYSYAAVLEQRLDIAVNKDQQKTFIGHTGPFSDKQIMYGAEDVAHSLPLCRNQCYDLQQDGLADTWVLECDALPAFCDMELEGFRFDTEAWKKILTENEAEKIVIESQMNEFTKQFWPTDMFGNAHINYGSPKQLLELMLKMRIKVKLRNPQTGEDELYPIQSTGDDVLKLIDGYPFVDLLRKHRKASKKINTYGQSFIDKINPITGKLHFVLNQLGTETGRPANKARDSDYNPLNLPREVKYRHAFIADPDHLIETDDYSGCELRIWAYISRDPGLLDAFRKGEDIHSYVATKIFKIPVSKTQNAAKRQLAKPVNFGIAYGMGPKTLYYRARGDGVDVTYEEMRKIYRAYCDDEFPTGVNYLREAGRTSIERGYAVNLGGRRRYWLMPNPNDRTVFPKGAEDGKYRGVMMKLEREAGNFEIQSVNADMLKLAMIKLRKEIKKNRWRTTFKNVPYDEIVTMTHKDDSPAFVEVKRKIMIEAAEHYVKDVPMEVEGDVMRSWTK